MKKFFYFAMIALVGVAFASCKPSEPEKKKITIAADDVQALFLEAEAIEAESDMWDFEFFNGEDYCASVAVKAIDGTHIAGKYSAILEGMVVAAAGDTVTLTSGTMEITYANGDYHFSFEVVGENTSTYVLELDYAAVDLMAIDYVLYSYYLMGYGAFFGINSIEDCLIELEDAPFVPTGKTIDIVIPGVSMLTDATAEEGWFQITGENAEYYASVCINTNKLVGTYADADFDYDYTAIYDANNKEIAAKSDAANTCTVTVDGDITKVEATFLAKDGNKYHVVMQYYIPTPTKTINSAVVGTVDADTYASYGFTLYEGENENYVVTLLLPQGAGTYSFGDIYGMNNTQGSYLGDLSTMRLINVVAATINVAANGSFEGHFISTDAIEYVISFTQGAEKVSVRKVQGKHVASKQLDNLKQSKTTATKATTIECHAHFDIKNIKK